MDFKQFEENVAAYVEGLLDEKMMRTMDAKRAEYPECESLARLHQNILAALESTEPVKAPAGLEQQILAAVEAETAVLKKTRRKALAVSISAAAALLAGLVPFMVGALKQSAAGLSGASKGLSVITIFAAHWWAGIETMYFIATDMNRWPSLQLFLEFISQRIEIPKIDITIPGYYLFVLFSFLAVLVWVTREYLGKQQRLVVSSFYRRSF